MLRCLERFFRFFFPKQLKNRHIYINNLKGLKGIEIGGPSEIFSSKGMLPIYDQIAALDGCNFSSNTVWEGHLKEGYNFTYTETQKGFQYIAEGSDMRAIEDGKYDFVLSCHNLEHFANPLKALYEWIRIIKKSGYLLLVIPHKDKTFDHNRPVTSLEHILDDFKNNVDERDETHFNEVLTLHDLSQDTDVNSIGQLRERTLNNFTNRCLHHHVFNAFLVVRLLNEINLQILSSDLLSNSIFILTQKVPHPPNNLKFLSAENQLYKKPGYPSDIRKNNPTYS